MLEKAVYQSLIDFSNDLRKDVKLYFSDREFLVEGKPYIFNDVFTKGEFSELLFGYLSESLSKEEFKEKLQQRIAFVHTPLILSKRK